MKTIETRLTRWRADTPGTDRVQHLNNAGSALPPRSVVRAVEDYLREEAELGGYETAAARRDDIEAAYQHVARLMGARRRNIALVGNATEAFAQAMLAFDFQPGDVVVTSRIDYPSNQIMYLALAERRGVEVLRAEDLPGGGVDPDSVRELARHPRCRLVALTWIPTNTGLVQAAGEVGRITSELGVPYLIDACQSVGQMPVDAPALGCDFLAATGRKFLRGPRGTGFLYVADRALDAGTYPINVDLHGADWVEADRFRLHDDARRFENWEFNYGLVVGLGEAARYALDEVGLETARDRSWALAGTVRERIGGLPGVRCLDRGDTLSAIATFDVEGREAQDLVEALRPRGVHTSAVTRESGVLDMDEKGVTSALRVSPHYYNTEEEIEHLAVELEAVLSAG